MPRSVQLRTLLLTLSVAFAAAPAAASASVASARSANWAGYAAHRNGVNFRSVSATWKVPAVNCQSQFPTYSAVWVGLGGFKPSSNALDQIGTESDCTSPGVRSNSVWYEFVPSPSHTISMTIHPGDTINAKVTLIGHHVTVKLTDATRHGSFSKSITASTVDASSAEWIVEAPSECFNNDFCPTLPLADFGVIHFARATAVAATGHLGSVSSPRWDRTKITLAPGGSTGAVFGGGGEAKPSALSHHGFVFQVNYSQTPAPLGSGPILARRAATAGFTVQPGGRRR